MAFSKRELVVVLVCVVFLLANLGAIGSRGRGRAKEAVCRANLRQWGVIWDIFTKDNDGYFHSGYDYALTEPSSGIWPVVLRPSYSSRPNITCCPVAKRGGNTSGTVAAFYWEFWNPSLQRHGCYGSYGGNAWCANPGAFSDNIFGFDMKNNAWRTPYVDGAERIPVMADCWYMSGWPKHTSQPPPDEESRYGYGIEDHMSRFCLNRHNGAVNGLFMDWSVRKIGLKELWTLKWHREYNTAGPWTVAGGVTPDDWPEWMRNFKDYD